jgi:hypothetical protein
MPDNLSATGEWIYQQAEHCARQANAQTDLKTTIVWAAQAAGSHPRLASVLQQGWKSANTHAMRRRQGAQRPRHAAMGGNYSRMGFNRRKTGACRAKDIEAGGLFFDRPGRREAATGYRQSSSASRLTAGALGFLTFTQYLDRPERS